MQNSLVWSTSCTQQRNNSSRMTIRKRTLGEFPKSFLYGIGCWKNSWIIVGNCPNEYFRFPCAGHSEVHLHCTKGNLPYSFGQFIYSVNGILVLLWTLCYLAKRISSLVWWFREVRWGLKLVKYKHGLWVPYQRVMDCEKMRKIARISLNFREKVYWQNRLDGIRFLLRNVKRTRRNLLWKRQ